MTKEEFVNYIFSLLSQPLDDNNKDIIRDQIESCYEHNWSAEDVKNYIFCMKEYNSNPDEYMRLFYKTRLERKYNEPLKNQEYTSKTSHPSEIEFNDNETYEKLLLKIQPRVIKNDEQLKYFSQIADELAVFALDVNEKPYKQNLHDMIMLISILIRMYESESKSYLIKYLPKQKPAEVIKLILKNRDLNYNDLANILKVNRQTVSMVLSENTKRKVPANWAKKLAKAFDVPAEWFLEE